MRSKITKRNVRKWGACSQTYKTRVTLRTHQKMSRWPALNVAHGLYARLCMFLILNAGHFVTFFYGYAGVVIAPASSEVELRKDDITIRYRYKQISFSGIEECESHC